MIKETIKKIPIFGSFSKKVFRAISGKAKFTTSSEYWEMRYKKGGNSGAGSYNQLAEFKGGIINQFVSENNIETVIEFGCGDGNQLKYFHFKSYIGFDISYTTISKCGNLYKSDSTKRFKVLKAYNREIADLVLSLDVIYHLIEDEVYYDYMERLFSSSDKYVIIYSSNDDEHENNNIVPHVKHRKFTNWIEQNAPKFELIKNIPNKYPFDGNNDISSYADFYIFRIQTK